MADSKDKKRTRVQLSCTACRSRKLKCCRTHPCTNCMKRGEASSCTFVGRGPRGRASHGAPSPSHVHDRLQHLENLILSFTQKKQKENEAQGQGDSGDSSGSRGDVQSNVPSMEQVPGSLNDPEDKDIPIDHVDQPGKLVVKDAGTRYIDDAHWRAIFEEINEVRESLQGSDEISDEDFIEDDDSKDNAPTLLFGLSKPASRDELLGDIPPRPVTDRLVSLFLNCKEPLVVVIHAPTFQKEYNLFWSRPHDVSLPWLAMLYAILTTAMLIHQRTGEPLLGNGVNPMDVVSTFKKRSAQCLVQSNYITPGRHKVEALSLYIMGEFYMKNDAQVGVSFLLAIAMKLAMRTGYHRDPQYYPAISVFDGEMRRRVWAFLLQIDILISFQTGFPRTVQSWQHDVELPRNLLNEDFNETTKHLPPSRPESEITVTSYTRAKSRLMTVFGRILDIAYSREPVPYEETLDVDRRLEEAHSLIPPSFKMRPIDQCITDSSDLIFRRYTLQLTYQKSRCVLHRRYLGEVHSNLRYAYSRVVCMNASKEILRCQADLYHENKPGGLMYGARHSANSIQHTDYLLAAMILCMELSYTRTANGQAKGGSNNLSVVLNSQEDLLSTLEMSLHIFEKSRIQSADAQKAYVALSIMLRRVKKDEQTIRLSTPSLSESCANGAIQSVDAQPPPYGSWRSLESSPYPLNASATSLSDPLTNTDTPYASLDVIGDMLDTPANLDWRLWDREIQGFEDPSGGDTMWYLQ